MPAVTSTEMKKQTDWQKGGGESNRLTEAQHKKKKKKKYITTDIKTHG